MASTTAPIGDQQADAKASAILKRAIMIDGLRGAFVAPEVPPRDGKEYLDQVLDAGVTAGNVTLAAHADTWDDMLHKMYAYFNLMSARPDKTMQVEAIEDIHRAKRERKIGLIFGLQSGTPIGKDISRWTIAHKLGVRVAQLTYNERNDFGDGCMEPENRGLTAYGRQAVQEMNRLGICVDISHVGERTALDATEYSSKPIIASHSNPRALCASRRNLTDEQMQKLAAGGGVMGINPHSMMTFRTPGVRPTLEDYLDMIDYSVQLIGVDHVAIGLDLNENWTKIGWESATKRMYPNPFTQEQLRAEGFSTISHLPNAVSGLVKRGYTDVDIEKILGGNWLRLYGECWTTSRVWEGDAWLATPKESAAMVGARS